MTTAIATTSPAAVVDSARAELLALAETLWAARRPEELLDTIRAVETLKSTIEAVELSVVEEIETSEAGKAEGWASARDMMTALAGGTRGHGPATVRLARSLSTTCPATMAALRDGDVSRRQAEVVVATVERLPVKAELRETAEQAMLDAARELNATDLSELGGELLELLDPDGCEAREERALARHERSAHLGRFLSIVDDGLGGVTVKGRGTVEDAATLKAALFPLARPLPAGHPGCGDSSRDPRDHSTRLWDAWVAVCQTALDTEVLPESHGAKPRISLTMRLGNLQAGVGTATLNTGDRISASAVRRLACDAGVVPIVLGASGEVLDVGRMQRLVTPAIWKALVARDGHCGFPGCFRPPIACDAHHVLSWLDGGATSLDNMVLLCRAHHTLVHSSEWRVRTRPGGGRPEFVAPPGLERRRRARRTRAPSDHGPPDG